MHKSRVQKRLSEWCLGQGVTLANDVEHLKQLSVSWWAALLYKLDTADPAGSGLKASHVLFSQSELLD